MQNKFVLKMIRQYSIKCKERLTMYVFTDKNTAIELIHKEIKREVESTQRVQTEYVFVLQR